MRDVILRKTVRIVAGVAAGLAVGGAFVAALSLYLPVMQARTGSASLCSWSATLYAPVAQIRRAMGESAARGEARVVRSEGSRLFLVESPAWRPWVALGGSESDAAGVLSHLWSEHEWMRDHNPEEQVRQGDVVLDCGAHVGSFSRFALDRGASKVVAFEPMESNLECLRRNFAREIGEGRYIIVPKAVWSTDGELAFTVSEYSSGTNSAVLDTGSKTIRVAAARIDTVVKELGIGKVSYIKMDIEGAEREALKGARETLAKHKPRLMIESYHLPDDSEVLPATVLAAQSGYQMECGPCGVKENRLIPYVLYFR